MQAIAFVKNDLLDKFGLPRQSGLVPELESTIEMLPEYSSPDFFREIEGFSHLWILWEFNTGNNVISSTVRPPRLGGNKRVGVFASRSPFRPNPIGISCVKLKKIEYLKNKTIITISGGDMSNDTPVLDIKPYLPYADSIPNAVGGYTEVIEWHTLNVDYNDEVLAVFSEEQKKAIVALLKQDIRPSYQNDPNKIYGMGFARYNIKFKVVNNTVFILEVL